MSNKGRISVVCLLVSVALLLAGCATSQMSGADMEGLERYRSEEVRRIIEAQVEDGTFIAELLPSRSYYFIQDVYPLFGKTITHITVPVGSTFTPEDGKNFYLTVTKFDIIRGRFIPTDDVYRIPINAKKNGLAPNTEGVCRLIDVDVRSFGIHLEENQTLGFGRESDSISLFSLAGTAKTRPILTEIATIDIGALGYFSRNGLQYNNGVLPFDFAWAEPEDPQVAGTNAYYEALTAKLKEKLNGKYLSVLGDSISTYGGISNNAKDNSTIKGNAVYYTANDERIPSSDFMYWSRLLSDLGMKRCVINAYSGSRVYGKDDVSFKDAGVRRAVELDNDNGTPDDPSDDIDPDLILVFLGINDLHNMGASKAVEIRDMVNAANGDEQALKAKLDSWFAALLENSDNAQSIEAKVNYNSFDQAYALMMYRIKERYPNAKILAMDYFPNNHGSYTASTASSYCQVVKVVCDYLGIDCLQWSKNVGITAENARFFTVDAAGNALHPGPQGQLLMERAILNKLDEIL